MHPFGSLLVAALAAGFASGSIMSSKSASFELKQTASHKRVLRNGPQALANAYKKYGKAVPEHVALAAATKAKNKKIKHYKRGSRGSATAESIMGDVEYLVNAHLGNDQQYVRFDFDTGSSDMWVVTTETRTSETKHVGITYKYNPKSSSSAKKLHGAHWKISYGDGSSCSGDVYTDQVRIGGLILQDQAVQCAKEVSPQFARGKGSGILGLAFPQLNTVKPQRQTTWFESLKPQLESPLFVADLRHQNPGTYFFGFIPQDAQNVTYTDVDSSDGFWAFNATTDHGDIMGIADTGTTLVLLVEEIVKAYYSNVPSAENSQEQGGYIFDCTEKLPDFPFTVGGSNITIPGELINYAHASGTKCFGGIQTGGEIPYNIFGDVAMKAAYVVFDVGNNRIGWGQKK
ncbi:hypothetical protein ARSEF4850_001143 [Beauveria asiatica]